MVPLMLLQLVVVLLLTAVQVFAMVFFMTPIAVALALRIDVSAEVIVPLIPLHWLAVPERTEAQEASTAAFTAFAAFVTLAWIAPQSVFRFPVTAAHAFLADASTPAHTVSRDALTPEAAAVIAARIPSHEVVIEVWIPVQAA